MRKDPLAFLSTELDNLKQQGLYRKLRVLEGKPESHTTYDHKSVVNLSSNNYLGLTTHPRLKQAALDAVEKFAPFERECLIHSRGSLDGREQLDALVFAR